MREVSSGLSAGKKEMKGVSSLAPAIFEMKGNEFVLA